MDIYDQNWQDCLCLVNDLLLREKRVKDQVPYDINEVFEDKHLLRYFFN